ncbi:TPA: CAP domain-containing protein [Candidatus Saccharibacteria bacterium]|nr:CAP domain-containing protein [Candidatus Saccharibacteria bacterium]HIO87440.1 CAP domain-containing protein [Candidatus Saccharibacteria bacterium]
MFVSCQSVHAIFISMSAIATRGFGYKAHTYFIASRRNDYRPNALRNPILLVLYCVVAALLVITSVVRQEVRSSSQPSVSSIENRLVGSINVTRGSLDMQPLSLNTQLSKAAVAKQLHMAEQDYWSHTSPDGTEPWDFVRSYNVTYAKAAETLARGFTEPEAVVTGWLNSPSHREALLEPSYSQIGLSITEGEQGYDAVALFIQPVSTIAATSGVLSDTTENSAQKVLAFDSPQLSRIATVVPQSLIYIVAGLSVINLGLLIMMLFTQHKVPVAQHIRKPFHEHPEVHMVLHVAIIGLLSSTLL